MRDPLDPPDKTVWLFPPGLVTTVSAPNKVCSISEYDAVYVPVPKELRLKLEELALFELVTDPVKPPSVMLKDELASGVVVLNAPLVEFVVWPLVRVAEEMDSTDWVEEPVVWLALWDPLVWEEDLVSWLRPRLRVGIVKSNPDVDVPRPAADDGEEVMVGSAWLAIWPGVVELAEEWNVVWLEVNELDIKDSDVRPLLWLEIGLLSLPELNEDLTLDAEPEGWDCDDEAAGVIVGITKSEGDGVEGDLDEGDEPVPSCATPVGNDDEEEKLDVWVAEFSVLDGVDSGLDGLDWVLDGVDCVLDKVMLLVVVVADDVIGAPLSILLGVIDAGWEVGGIPDVVVADLSRPPWGMIDDNEERRDSRDVGLGDGDGVTVSVDEVPFTTNRFICLG